MKHEFKDSSLPWILVVTGLITFLYLIKAWIDDREGAMVSITIAYLLIASGVIFFMVRPPHWVLIDESRRLLVIKNRFPQKEVAIPFAEIKSVTADVVRAQRSYARLRIELYQHKTYELNFTPKNVGGFFSSLTPAMPEKVAALEEAIRKIVIKEEK